MNTSEKNFDELIPRNKYTFEVSFSRLSNLLQKIHPQKGNFLFVDIIGRLIWNSVAIANSMNTLIKNNDDYGLKSLSRKLFECYLSLEYLFSTQDKTKAIALIMAYHAFELKDNSNDFKFDKAIDDAELVINKFGEDQKIIAYLKSFLDPNRKRRGWHWSEMSFEKMIKNNFQETGVEKMDSFIIQSKLKELENFNKAAHIDLDLINDYLKETEDGKLEYISPLETSKSKLYAYIGLARLTINNIINMVEEKLNLKE